MADFSGAVDTMKGWLGEGKKMLFGDPDAIKKAYDQAIGLSQQGSNDITNFLMGRQANAQRYFAPAQHMLQSAYGTEGVAAPQIPQAQQPGALAQMYGGR
jgi:hypothetical protein